LVELIKKIEGTDLKVGKDVGILSYNDTPLKEILLNGISVITTDHETMGRTAALLILENKQAHVDNPCRLILRASL
jgi:DNA-binding LacI/PurR family transcriptional regulator